MIMPVNNIFTRHRGNITFHPSFMSWSKRKRGKVPRTQMKKKTNAKVLIRNQAMGGSTGPCQPPKKRVVHRALATMMWQYSPIMNKPHFMELYSVWKPATSSFSHSIKSKGVRAHSAMAAIRNSRDRKSVV